VIARHDRHERELALRGEITTRVVQEERVAGAVDGANPVERLADVPLHLASIHAFNSLIEFGARDFCWTSGCF
jgi:hypothetical protein